MHQVWAVAIIALCAVMCLLGFGILFGLASFWMNPGGQVLMRFLPVALFPFAWALLIAFLIRRNGSRPLLAVVTAIVFVAFIGAVDFANDRPIYSGLNFLTQTPR